MKYLFHPVIYFLIFYLLPLESLSQADILRRENGHFVRFGAGLDLVKTRDTEFSSMLFVGLVPSFNINTDFGKNFHHQVNVGYSIGTIKGENAQDNRANYKSFSTDYFFSKSATYGRDRRWYGEPGGGINFIFSERKFENFINQNKSKEVSGSLSVYYNVIYVLSESKGWTISDRIFIPAVSVISQPEIWAPEGEEPDVISERAMKTNVYFIPDYFRVNNTISLSKNVDDKHSFHLLYTWDFYKIAEVYRKERIYHSLIFSYQIKI